MQHSGDVRIYLRTKSLIDQEIKLHAFSHEFLHKSKSIVQCRYTLYSNVQFIDNIELAINKKISCDIVFYALIIDTFNDNFLLMDNDYSPMYMFINGENQITIYYTQDKITDAILEENKLSVINILKNNAVEEKIRLDQEERNLKQKMAQKKYWKNWKARELKYAKACRVFIPGYYY
jgi:hypothetical protein